MKKSDRTLRATLVALAAAVVVVVAANRILFPRWQGESVPRTTDAELAVMRDFDAIRVEGNFALRVVEQPEFSVRYTPWHPVQGRFNARVEDRTLVLVGHGNRMEDHVSLVEVGLPALRLLSATYPHRVEVSGMRAVPLTLRVLGSPLVRLTDNHVELTLALASVGKLQIDPASRERATTFEIRGQTRIENLP